MRNVAVKVNGDTLDASEFNPSTQECMNAVTNTGQSLDASNNFQVSTAISVYSACGNFYTDSGSANSYILAITGSLQSPVAYRDGMLVRFAPTNSNTGASTITVASLGSTGIVRQGGSALEVGDLTAGIYANAVYNAGLGAFILLEQNQPVIAELAFGFMQNKPGYLFMQDGYTIGNSVSGATYAGTYTENLFVELYTVQDDTKCPVSGGRTGDATTDYNAGKILQLPLMASCAIGGVGTSNRGLTTRYLGDFVGEETHTLDITQIPVHTHQYNDPINDNQDAEGVNGSPTTNRTKVWPTLTGATGSVGGGAAHNTMQPTIFMNWFIKY